MGRWDPPEGGYDWEDLIAVHAAHLPTGKVLVWSAGSSASLWDPVTGDFTEVPTTLPIHCSGHASLADGSILVAGGQGQGVARRETGIFNLVGGPPDPWTQVGDMNFARWYPTCTTLPDGRVLVVTGSESVNAGCPQCIPEIYDPSTGSWEQLAVGMHDVPQWYPFMFVAPDGGVFFAGGDGACGAGGGCTCPPQDHGNQCGRFSYMLDVELETWTEFPPHDDNDSFFRGDKGSAVMYEPGKVLKSGGGLGIFDTAIIDLNDVNPQWELADEMIFARRLHNLVLLPDGKILAVGGNNCPGCVNVFEAEWFDPNDPVQPEWTLLASMTIARANHSTAVLLPDSTVLAAGGTDSAEIFRPPYLFKNGNEDADQPLIGFAPTAVIYDTSFSVLLARGSPVSRNEIEKVTFVRLGSVTHGFDMGQRYLSLAVQTDPTRPNGLIVEAPANGNLAPPGYYMLFLISDTGAPCKLAKYVKLTPPPSP